MSNPQSTIANNIYFTPTKDQILEIARENPDLNEKIKSSILNELQENAYKYCKNKLQQQANTVFQETYNKIEKEYFKSNSNWSSSYTLSDKMQKELAEKINARLTAEIDLEFNTYLESPTFKQQVKYEIQSRMLSAVMKELDAQIAVEAKKLTA